MLKYLKYICENACNVCMNERNSIGYKRFRAMIESRSMMMDEIMLRIS